MTSRPCNPEPPALSLPSLRFEISEAARILRISRAQLYNRIHEGSLKRQKDGARTYITRVELERYVESCNPRDATIPLRDLDHTESRGHAKTTC